MANRRMFSVRITESARFLKMPPSSQNLYFHLGMKADDDGIVEAYPVMCMTSSTEDDLRVLIGKGFVTVLNDDLVIYIDDWLENNNIRADRKIDSIYKDLLLQIVPDVKIKTAKPSYYSRTKEICQTNDGQVTDNCQHRIGNVSIGKDSVENALCPEPEQPSQDPSGILLSLVDKTEYNVPLSKIEKWKTAYPAVDIIQELHKMAAWLDSNPQRRKTRRGIDRFINSWLSREQDKGRSYNPSDRQQIPEPVSNDYPPDYAKDYIPRPDDPFQ